MNFVGNPSSAQCVLNNSDVSSSDDEADTTCTLTTRRSLPHGAFAHALKSSRLQSNPVNSSNHWISENPKYGNIMRLYCKTGFHLKVTPDGRVCGTQDENDRFAIMETGSAGTAGHITIQGKESKLYIAMDRKGRLYGEANKNRPQTTWLEELIGSYTTYMSRNYAHLGWFMGIKKSGKPKKGVKTGWGQRATQFLPRRLT